MQPDKKRSQVVLRSAVYRHESGMGQIWTIHIWNTATIELGDKAVYVWQCDPPEGHVELADKQYEDADEALQDAVNAIWERELKR